MFIVPTNLDPKAMLYSGNYLMFIRSEETINKLMQRVEGQLELYKGDLLGKHIRKQYKVLLSPHALLGCHLYLSEHKLLVMILVFDLHRRAVNQTVNLITQPLIYLSIDSILIDSLKKYLL